MQWDSKSIILDRHGCNLLWIWSCNCQDETRVVTPPKQVGESAHRVVYSPQSTEKDCFFKQSSVRVFA